MVMYNAELKLYWCLAFAFLDLKMPAGSSSGSGGVVPPEIMQKMQKRISEMRDPLLKSQCDAYIERCEEQAAKEKHRVEFKKEHYKQGIECMGKRCFEALVTEAGTAVAKEYLKKAGDKTFDRNIVKFRKSQLYQEELQKARMEQKQKDKEMAAKQKVLNIITKLKKTLKGMKKEHRDEAIEDLGLHKIKEAMDKAEKPELRPKWIGFPAKHPGIC